MYLSIAKNSVVFLLVEQFKKLDSVNNNLQLGKTKMADTRDLFDVLINIFLSTASRLQHNAAIVHNPNLDAEIVKIQLGNQRALGWTETIEEFEETMKSAKNHVDENFSFTEQALKRQCRESGFGGKACVDLRFLLFFSYICDFIFFKAGYVFTDH